MPDTLLPKQKSAKSANFRISYKVLKDVQFRKQCASLFGWEKAVSMMFILARIGYTSKKLDTENLIIYGFYCS